MTPPRRVRRPAAIAAGCLLTVAVGVLLAHEGHAPLPSKGAEVDVAKGFVRLSPDARAALDVGTAEVGTAAPPDAIPAPAALVAPWAGHAFAVSRLAGRIVALHAKPGDRVEAGQVLAEVQSQELEALRLEVRTAGTEARLAEHVLRGLTGSAAAVPDREVLAAEVQVRQTRNALDLARIKWRALGLPGDADAEPAPALPVRSPVAGTVIHADLAVGKVVEPGEHLFEVVDLSTVWARVGLLEQDIPRVAAGQPVEVRLTAYPGEAFRGTVTAVGPGLDPVTHLNDVWVEFRNPAGAEPRLLPGLSGTARVELPAVAGTLTVPTAALVDDGVDRFVLVEEANAAGVSEFRKRSVAVVRETAGVVEVRSADLYPGDRVVLRGGHQLGAFFAPGVLRLTPEAARTIGLAVEPATVRPVGTVVEVPGAVELPPDRRGVATARLPGTIVSIAAGPGREVAAGDTLAEVFSPELLTLQLDLLREHLAADLAGQQLARLRGAGANLSGERRLAEAEAANAAAAGRRDGLRRRLELAGLTAARLDALTARREVVPVAPVRAPVAGRVASFDRVIGQAVRADEPLFEVHAAARPWVRGFVSEGELARVRVGQGARARPVGLPSVVLEGKVARSGRTVGAADRALSVWVELDRDPPVPLRHNGMARLALTVGDNPATLAVPLGAVHREGTRAFVFVRTGDTFERREVAVGRADDRFAEITRGLAAAEPVAVAGVDALNTAWQSVR